MKQPHVLLPFLIKCDSTPSLQFDLWLGSLGFTLIFGGILVRTWRIHYIFNRIVVSKVKAKVSVGGDRYEWQRGRERRKGRREKCAREGEKGKGRRVLWS